MEEFINLAKTKIPSVDYIIEISWKNLNFDKRYVYDKFGEALVAIDEEATKTYKYYERQALIELTKLWLESQKENIKRKLEKILLRKGWEDFIKEASELFVEFGKLVQALEKDLGNMRKARGGKSFEKVILKLLNFIDINGEIPTGEAREKLRRIDIVIPSINIALLTPDKAIFLTCKRTLRERWKQEVPQVKPNQRVYLLTIDTELSKSKAKEINEKGLIAFIQDNLKEKDYIKEMPWIRKLSEFPKELRNL